MRASWRPMSSRARPSRPPRRDPIAPQVAGVRSFAVAPDGTTFYAIVNEHGDAVPTRDITVVTGWPEEVRRLVGTGAR